MKRILWPVLLIVSVGLLWLAQQPDARKQHMDVWPSIERGDIAQMEIRQARGTVIELKLVEGQWHLADGSLAAQDAAWHLLDDVAAMSPIRVVTYGRQHDDELGLLSPIQLRCLDKRGTELLVVSIGKQGSDLLSTYVRLKDSDAVVAVNRSLLWQVKRSSAAWKAMENKAS